MVCHTRTFTQYLPPASGNEGCVACAVQAHQHERLVLRRQMELYFKRPRFSGYISKSRVDGQDTSCHTWRSDRPGFVPTLPPPAPLLEHPLAVVNEGLQMLGERLWRVAAKQVSSSGAHRAGYRVGSRHVSKHYLIPGMEHVSVTLYFILGRCTMRVSYSSQINHSADHNFLPSTSLLRVLKSNIVSYKFSPRRDKHKPHGRGKCDTVFQVYLPFSRPCYSRVRKQPRCSCAQFAAATMIQFSRSLSC